MNLNSQIKDDQIIRFTNCILVDNGVSYNNDIWIRNAKIIDDHNTFYNEKLSPDLIIDCKGKILCPGFIDLQINGGHGIDFSSDVNNTADNLRMLGKELLKTGVTAFCPTLVTSSSELYNKVLPQIKRSVPSIENGAGVIGVHLEGPFINPDRKGAHNQSLIQKFDNGVDSILNMYGPGLDNASIVTLAPELERSDEIVRYLTDEKHICVSLGHSATNLVQAENAVNCGARMITHLFNAMLPYHHRDPHLVGLLTSDKIKRQIYFGIIADEIHTHPSALRLAWSALPSGLTLVTDAMSAFGLGTGSYNIGGLNVRVLDDGRAVLADNHDTLAGSTVTIPKCIWNLSQCARCSIPQAIQAVTKNPAKILNIPQGSLKYGSYADIVLLDQHDTGIKVQATFTRGKLAFIEPGVELGIRQC